MEGKKIKENKEEENKANKITKEEEDGKRERGGHYRKGKIMY
jgi:hypothetical protein